MQVIYTITGGDWLADSLNAVAVLTASATWGTLIKWASILSVLAVIWSWLQKKDVLTFIKWVAVIVIVPGVLIANKHSVQVIDMTDPTAVHQVDNVPGGLAIPASLITSVGYALTQAYESVFHRPDAVSYSKTGMLFGSELVKASTGFTFADGEIAGLFSDYVQNCVIGDIFLNHKYSMEDLMNSTDPYSKIFEKPSPLRGIFDKAGNFQTCQQAAVTLQQQIGTDSSGGGKTFSFWAQKLFGSRANREQLFASLLGDSYGYFYNAGSSASGIIKQNVVMNGLRKGISAYAARNGDTASMMNIATETATEKQIMQQSVSANIAMKYLPIMQTVLLGMMIGLFPVMIVLAIINTLTWTVLKGYIFTLAYLQAWPLLFAVLNNAMTFYLKAGGAYDVTLSNLSQIQQQHSMIASTAGWLSLSIPFIAYGMVKGLGGVVSQAGSYLSSMTQGVASQSSSQAVDGTYAFNNMQTDNVQGFKWDTNSTFASGRRDQQLANGSMQGTTADGTTIVNSTTGTSKLPMDLNFGRAMSSSAQRLARESQVQAETSLQGFNHAMNSAYNQAQQFSQQTGNSNTMNTSTDDSQTAQATRGVSSMISAAKDYARRHGISEQQAWAEMESKSRNLEAYASVSAGVKPFGIGIEGGVKGNVSTGSQSSADQRQTGSTDHTSSEDAKNVRDFREGKQILQSYRVSHSAVRNDNSSASQLEQIGTTLSVADSQYQQYTSSVSRSHEYSKVASMSESETAQQTSNLSQEFVGYVQQKAPGDASRILTNTADENVRHEREALADSFVEEKLRSRIEGDFNSNRASLASGMQSVEPSTGDAAGTINSGQQEIERRAQLAGIKGNITQGVDDSLTRNQGVIKQTGANIEQGHGDVQRESDRLKSEHGKVDGDFVANYNKASEHQGLGDLRNNPGDISDMAKKLKERRREDD
ncbi:TPA: conjugal transfer mating pair stabilization protein TraG [Salmonella enterica]|nr:conjugal transfer protein TraG [Salmonella enterica subsp. enterica serovar Vitkin]ECB7067360.1 conjugal transfer protein TraG [Salmonella enterica subsp. enterica serovar Typhimurium]ECV7438481.1 conjugal transfer mating pair stabilization protein TraG [Salmonella enterica subsp. enterica serovar Newport]EDD8831920.1 conjugal transfer mating pair stabilization protein TraG [Salmonella enterica subsp. enterica serovar Mikawasima]HAK7700303.1 conjugal transfer mating pair stabilization protei